MRSDIDIEFKILKTVCNGKEHLVGQLLPSLHADHFSTSITQGLYRRILKLYKRGEEIPNWQDLRYDPGVRPDTRKAMREIKTRPYDNFKDINSSLGTLDKLRQVRLLFEAGAELEKALDEDEIDPEDIARDLQSRLGKISKHGRDTVVTRVGKGGNSLKKVKKLLNAESSKFISTGFRRFDRENVGIPNSGIFLVASETSGGKSTMLDNILENMAKKGAKIAKLPLEMDGDEVLTRDLARESGESLSNLIDPAKRITQQRRDEIEKRHLKFSKMLAKRGGYIDIIEPGFEPTLEAMLAYCDPFDYDVIAIDYIGLMAGVNGEDQWRALSNALAYAKRWAGRANKKTMIIFAAQLAADETLRQSKAMPDHCTNLWIWKRPDSGSNIVLVKQAKCRFGRRFDFPLYFDFEHMEIRDLTDQEYDDWIAAQKAEEQGKSGNGASWKSGSKKKKKVDLPEEDDDDEEEAEVVKLKPRKKRKSSEY